MRYKNLWTSVLAKIVDT